MTGWPAVFVTTGLMVVALAGFNIRLWRRMKAATAAAKRQAERDASPHAPRGRIAADG